MRCTSCVARRRWEASSSTTSDCEDISDSIGDSSKLTLEYIGSVPLCDLYPKRERRRETSALSVLENDRGSGSTDPRLESGLGIVGGIVSSEWHIIILWSVRETP